jgi:hypothetical protein
MPCAFLIQVNLPRRHSGGASFCRTAAIGAGAQTAFYRELADLSERCVRLEAAQSGAR